jgi:hypothetical protein
LRVSQQSFPAAVIGVDEAILSLVGKLQQRRRQREPELQRRRHDRVLTRAMIGPFGMQWFTSTDIPVIDASIHANVKSSLLMLIRQANFAGINRSAVLSLD